MLLSSSDVCLIAGGSAPPAPGPAEVAPKPRVFVTESDSWQISGSGGGGGDAFASTVAGGARPQTAEVIKTLAQRCPQVVVNQKVENCDYVIRLEHEGGKGMLRKKDKVVVFVRRSADSIFSASTLSVGGAVQDSCKVITGDWGTLSKQPVALIASTPTVPAQAATPLDTSSASTASLTVNADVPNSDIEVDGVFEGSTPSTVYMSPGEHVVVVKKKGYADWSRKMKVAGNGARVSAEMDAK